MSKKISAILACIMLTATLTTGCSNNTNSPVSGTENSTEASTTAPTNATTFATDNVLSESATTNEATTQVLEVATNDTIEVITEAPTDNITEDVYEFVDETVTNPTVAPIESTPESDVTNVNITADDLVGEWKPLMAVKVSDGKEVDFNTLFGSSYREYGGKLAITENGNFTISMGAAIIEAKGSGTFQLSDNNLLVTYKGGAVDTYLYIPNYQGKEVIKVQINNAYIYFCKQ